MFDIEGVELDDEVKAKIAEQFQSKVDEEVNGLKLKVDELLKEKKAAQSKAEQEAEARQLAAEEAAKKSGDVESLEKSWTEKFTSKEQEYNGLLSEKDNVIRNLTVNSKATQLAAELGGENSAGLLPHITPRLDVEIKDGKANVFVKDNSGQRSALTVEELKAELIGTDYLAPLIVASNATGGGAQGNKSAGGASNNNMTADEKRAAQINKKFGI